MNRGDEASLLLPVYQPYHHPCLWGLFITPSFSQETRKCN